MTFANPEIGESRPSTSKLGGGLTGAMLGRALGDAFVKLNPRHLLRNPVIFVTWIVALLATVSAAGAIASGQSAGFAIQLALWLWATVLFANVAESVAEGRGKAAADSLRATRVTTPAKLVDPATGAVSQMPAGDLTVGSIVLVEAGDVIPSDGEIIEGVASVNEAAITGESAPVIRESGGDRSAVTGGTTVVSDWLKIRITSAPGSTFLDRMIAMVEGANRRKTPNELALSVLLAGLTLVFLIAVVTLLGLGAYSGVKLDPIVLGALFITLIPTTIGGLLSAVGIAGMDRLLKVNVLATSGRAVEAAGDVDTLLLDKTGTITFGNRMATEVIPVAGVRAETAMRAAVMASLADETPEGRSIVELGRNASIVAELPEGAKAIPFTAMTRQSGVDAGTLSWRKGAVDAVLKSLEKGAVAPAEFTAAVDRIARSGGTPLAVTENGRLVGVIHLKDVVKPGVKARFAELRAMGLRTVMITGDNPVTAAAIASEAGVDDYLAEATPEDKMRLIKAEQAKGRLVAMCGDGANDAPALAQADVGVAMQTGAQAAREAGNMVDLDSDPTKVIEIVEVGKQLLITRGALTTFSIANDVAKYFAIIPAMFVVALPALGALNVMQLGSPESAILSAVIFNALVIVALIPLALRGVKYRAVGASKLLGRNLLIYGLGGLVAPFVGIKAIDLIITGLGLT